MRLVVLAVSLSTIVGAYRSQAQGISVTVAQAEAEGAAFPRAGAQVASQPLFAGAPNALFAGISDRRCVSSTTEDPRATGSLRSGDMIVRGGFVHRHDMQAGKPDKLLWVPLHATGFGDKYPLVLRADRIDHPADSLRVTIKGLARGGGPVGPMYGYPSLVSFPNAGQWLVVATAGDDWGCFIVDVAAVPVRAPS